MFYDVAVYCFITVCGIVISLSFIVPWLAGREVHDLFAHAPVAVGIGTAACIGTYIFLNIALWNIYGFSTPIITTVLSIAACLAPNLLPF